MGQTITVTVSAGASDTLRMFSLNRSLTGMAIERYANAEAAGGTKIADVLAKRLFELGAQKVTVYSNAVSVEAAEWQGLEAKVVATIEHLFNYYGDDAGWSVEALEPYGIHRKPSPVQ